VSSTSLSLQGELALSPLLTLLPLHPCSGNRPRRSRNTSSLHGNFLSSSRSDARRCDSRQTRGGSRRGGGRGREGGEVRECGRWSRSCCWTAGEGCHRLHQVSKRFSSFSKRWWTKAEGSRGRCVPELDSQSLKRFSIANHPSIPFFFLS